MRFSTCFTKHYVVYSLCTNKPTGVYWFRLADIMPPAAGQAPTCKTSKTKLTAKKEDEIVLDEAEFALAA